MPKEENRHEIKIPIPAPPLPSLEWEDWAPMGVFPLPPLPKWATKPYIEVAIGGDGAEETIRALMEEMDIAVKERWTRPD